MGLGRNLVVDLVELVGDAKAIEDVVGGSAE